MDRKTAINIGLHMQEQVIDLRIPLYVNKMRLKELLVDVFNTMHIQLPLQWDIQIMNKKIRIHDSIELYRYPLGDGDQFQIVDLTKGA
ncbi:MAG: type VII secretion protein, YukD family [Candidatus Kurthia intestinigallinarum]|uniref:type VII secretion protein, YukD family n=1 Tax=Kurthia sp. Dielmo TaxID=1033738 RepID=UPI0011238988|nr:type VII secretion protein, YukD family [Kurthia sp. Dielmo]